MGVYSTLEKAQATEPDYVWEYFDNFWVGTPKEGSDCWEHMDILEFDLYEG